MMLQKTKLAKNSKKKSKKLKGRGDYSNEVLNIKDPSRRLEAKIDHLEKSLVQTTPKINKAAGTIGRTLGNFINQGDLGALAGESLAKLFGHGDYDIKTNSLMAAAHVSGSVVPSFSKNGKRGTRIVEREFLIDVYSGPLVGGASTFQNFAYRINPTDVTTFPWLSTIATQFDQWEPHGIVFEFVSTSSTFNGTSQALGTVVMATEYDVYDGPFTNKQVMENADYSCSTKPSSNLLHGVECDKSERPTQILYTSSTGGALLTDLGLFQIMTIGCSTAGTKLGELWISYDLTFYKKQQTLLSNTLSAISGTGANGVGGPFIGPNPIISYQKDFTYIVTATTFTMNFPPSRRDGKFIFVYFMNSYGAADEPDDITCGNCSESHTASMDGNNLTIVYAFTLTDQNAWFRMNGQKKVLSSAYRFCASEVNPSMAW